MSIGKRIYCLVHNGFRVTFVNIRLAKEVHYLGPKCELCILHVDYNTLE